MLFKSPDQAGYFGAQDAGVGVHLVQHQVAGLDAVEDFLVILAE